MRTILAGAVAVVWANEQDDEALLLQTKFVKQHMQQDPDAGAGAPDPFVDLCEDFSEEGLTELTVDQRVAWGATDNHRKFDNGAVHSQYTAIKMHGPWDRHFREIERTWTLNPATTECQISWSSYSQHSRDNEHDRLFADDVKIWEQRMSGNHQHDQVFTVACSGELKLRWTSDIDEDLGNEAWGFNNVVIKQNDCVPNTTPPPNPGACGPGRSCAQLKVVCPDGIEWNAEAAEVGRHGDLKVDCADGGAWIIRAMPSYTTTTTLCPPVIYDETETGALGDGWSSSVVGPGINEHTDIAAMHGPWGNELREVTKEFDVLGGNDCTLSWTSYGMHSRDNEWDRVFVNGEKVWEHQMRGGHEHEATWTGPCDGGDGKLTLRYTSEIDEARGNEAWGFNKVKLEQAGCEAPTQPPPR